MPTFLIRYDSKYMAVLISRRQNAFHVFGLLIIYGDFIVAVAIFPRHNDINFGCISMYDIRVKSLKDTVMTAYTFI